MPTIRTASTFVAAWKKLHSSIGHYVQSLQLHMVTLQDLRMVPPNTLHVLKGLLLHVTHMEKEESSSECSGAIRGFEDLLLLERVAIKGYNTIIKLPWHRITCIALWDSASHPIEIGLLINATHIHLDTAKIVCAPMNSRHHGAVLPSVTTLSLAVSFHLPSLFCNSLPIGLVRLRLGLAFMTGPAFEEQFNLFCTALASCTSLTSLTLLSTVSNNGFFRQLAQSVPHLTHLELGLGGFNAEVATIICDESNLCALQHLTIHLGRFGNISSGTTASHILSMHRLFVHRAASSKPIGFLTILGDGMWLEALKLSGTVVDYDNRISHTTRKRMAELIIQDSVDKWPEVTGCLGTAYLKL